MNTHTCSFVNTIPKYIHTNINPIYTYTNTDVINMHMHAHTHTHIYIYIYIYIYMEIHIYIYIYIYTYTHTYVHKHIHIPINTTQSLSHPLFLVPIKLIFLFVSDYVLRYFIFYSVPSLSKSFAFIPIIYSYSFF